MLIFEKRLPEPQPIRINKIEIMNKKLNKVPSAGTKADSEQKVENMQVCQHNAKPNVVRSPNSLSSELLFARKMYLCVQLLGGRSDILATIGSWRKEASDEQTFELLDCWIDATINEQKSSLEYVTEWHNK